LLDGYLVEAENRPLIYDKIGPEVENKSIMAKIMNER